MEKEIFTSELDQIAEEFKIHIWVAEKMGRRWSFIAQGGEEMMLLPKLVHKDGKYGFFAQGDFDTRILKRRLKKVFKDL